MFDKPGTFYSNDPNTVFDSQWLIDHSKIETLKSHTLSILDFSSEHYGIHGIDHVYHALEDHNVNFILLTHDIHDHKRLPRLFFYSFWFYYSIKSFNLSTTFPAIKHFAWSCLNLNPRPHRIYNFCIARSKPYFDQSIFSMYNHETVGLSRKDDVVLSPEMLSFWDNIKESLPDRNSIVRIKGSGNDITIPAFTDCYTHLVSESTVMPKVFITEKTWKPIAAQQLFLVLGNPGTVQALRMLGVDVFDDIVDHSYDNETDWQRRIDLIYQSLESLIALDLETLYQQTELRRKKNFDAFMSSSLGSKYKQDLLDAIDTYLK